MLQNVTSMTGPRYVLISAFGFAVMAALVKEAGVLGIPLLQIIFVRAVISVVLSLADIRRAGVHPLGNKRGLLFARGFCGFAALTGVFYALIHLSMAQATLLQYLHPVFTALLAFLFLGRAAHGSNAKLHRAEPHGAGLHSQPVCGGHWFSGTTGLASSGRPWRRTGERDRLYPCAKTDGHRAPVCDCVVFPLGVPARHVAFGGERFRLADRQRLVGVVGGGLLYATGSTGFD